MTSVAESLVTWLTTYSGISAVTTDQVGEEATSLGVIKSPGRNVQHYVDGSKDVTGYFLFRARRSAQMDDMRVDNQEWLEALETWVREQSFARSLPSLGNGRICQSVGVSESAYLLEAAESDIVYQIGLEIVYFEPKALTPDEEPDEEPEEEPDEEPDTV